MTLQQILKDQILLLKTGEQIIGQGRVSSLLDRELILKGEHLQGEMIEGISIICEFQYEGNPAHFNAKIKTICRDKGEVILFLLGEMIVDFKRNYLRINDQIGIYYERVAFDQVDRYYHQVFQNQQQEPAFDQLLHRHDPYFKIFQFLVRKLDQMSGEIEQLRGALNPGEGPKFQYNSVNISASGIRFMIPGEHHFQVGDLIYMVLKLETIPVTHINIIGEVLRMIPRDNEEIELVVEFRLLDNRVKEQLVQYVFQRDQQQIRNRIR